MDCRSHKKFLSPCVRRNLIYNLIYNKVETRSRYIYKKEINYESKRIGILFSSSAARRF